MPAPLHVSGVVHGDEVRQQGSPAPPQETHAPEVQVSGALTDELHVPSPQQDCPAPPHAEHRLFSHTTSGAVHPVSQHACPAAPQPPQLPAAQTPASVNAHVVPAGTQKPETQHPSAAHVLAAQHTSPAVPQPVHTPAPASPWHWPSLHIRPGQQL